MPAACPELFGTEGTEADSDVKGCWVFHGSGNPKISKYMFYIVLLCFLGFMKLIALNQVWDSRGQLNS